MGKQKFFFFMSLVLVLVAFSWGIAGNVATQVSNDSPPSLQTQGNKSSVTKSQNKPKLSKRNQQMLEQAEWAQMRRLNILAVPQGGGTTPK